MAHRLLRRPVLLALATGAAAASLAYSATSRTRSGASLMDADAVLLSPSDFPNGRFREVQRLGSRETRDGGQAAQVVLKDDRVEVFQSVVAYPTEDDAREAFQAATQQAMMVSGQVLPNAPAFGEESVVLRGKQGDQDTVSVVFRQGTILVRVTVAGTVEVEALVPVAERTVEKVTQR